MNKNKLNQIMMVQNKNLRINRLNIYNKAITRYPKDVYKLFINYPNYNKDRPEDWSIEFYIKLINISSKNKKNKCIIL